MDLAFRETGSQPYTDSVLSAGLVDGHATDDIYLKLEREHESEVVILLRRDEAAAVIWLLAGALWSEAIGGTQ